VASADEQRAQRPRLRFLAPIRSTRSTEHIELITGGLTGYNDCSGPGGSTTGMSASVRNYHHPFGNMAPERQQEPRRRLREASGHGRKTSLEAYTMVDDGGRLKAGPENFVARCETKIEAPLTTNIRRLFSCEILQSHTTIDNSSCSSIFLKGTVV
jgi:hypothetical protein